MIKTILNEDVDRIINSYITDYERWISLRKKYNNSFLREGLDDKTNRQLAFIQMKFIRITEEGELSDIDSLFLTYDGLVEAYLKNAAKELKEIKKDFSTVYPKKTYDLISRTWWQARFMLGNKLGRTMCGHMNKEEKIEDIIKFFDRIDDIIDLNSVVVGVREVKYLEIHVNKSQIKPEFQDFWASKALKVLLLLVSILKHPKKTEENATP